MLLHDVAIAAAFAFLQHVAGPGEVVDNGVRAALGDPEQIRDIAQAHPGIMRDAQQCPPVIGQESPLGHHGDYSKRFRVVVC